MKLIHYLRLMKLLGGRLWQDLRSPVRSYSQHQEDLVVQEMLGTVRSFVDIGANDGFTFSNTRRFARQKAAGLYFEPERGSFWKCRFLNIPFSRVRCVRGGVSDYDGIGVVQTEGYQGLLTRITRSQSSGHGLRPEVRMATLTDWISKLRWRHSVDLVSIDVEGGEESVLRGIDFKTFSAKAWVIETDKTEIARLNALLVPAGYSPALTNGLNTIWLAVGLADGAGLDSIARRWPGWNANV
jgi:FkbM family methyltransferase